MSRVKLRQTSLFHNVELVRRFYEQFPKAVVGIEASYTAAWFEQMMNDLGHELKNCRNQPLRLSFLYRMFFKN